uniref:26S proteasome non-ATPase regulatory subunit 10 n=1 Tax=Magallana gigas TaxID=29159 RepID=K1R7E5_MAGGI
MSMKRGYSRASQNSLDKMQNGTGDNSSLGTEDDSVQQNGEMGPRRDSSVSGSSVGGLSRIPSIAKGSQLSMQSSFNLEIDSARGTPVRAAESPSLAKEVKKKILQAAKKNDTELLSRLLAEFPEADLTAVDENGKTALHHCANNADASNTDTLLSRGAQPNTIDKNGQTPLHIAAKKDAVEVIEMLAVNGALLDYPDAKTGQTALHYAVAKNFLSSVQILIFSGADSNVKDKQGRTPHIVCRSKEMRTLLSMNSSAAANVSMGEMMLQTVEIIGGAKTYCDRLDITIDFNSGAVGDKFSMMCRRQPIDFCDVSFNFGASEEVISDVITYRVQRKGRKTLCIFTVPIYCKPLSTEEVILKSNEGHALIVSKVFEKDKVFYCEVPFDLPELNAFVFVARTKQESFTATSDNVTITSEVNDKVKLILPKGTFEGPTKLFFQVTEPPNADILETSEMKDVYSITPFVRVEAENHVGPKQDVQLQLPLPEEYGVGGTIKIFTSNVYEIDDISENSWTLLDTRCNVTKDAISFDSRTFSLKVAVETKKDVTFETLRPQVHSMFQKARKRDHTVAFVAMSKRLEESDSFQVAIECATIDRVDDCKSFWLNEGFKDQRPKKSQSYTIKSREQFILFVKNLKLVRDSEDIQFQFHARRRNFQCFTVETSAQVKKVTGQVQVMKILPNPDPDQFGEVKRKTKSITNIPINLSKEVEGEEEEEEMEEEEEKVHEVLPPVETQKPPKSSPKPSHKPAPKAITPSRNLIPNDGPSEPTSRTSIAVMKQKSFDFTLSEKGDPSFKGFTDDKFLRELCKELDEEWYKVAVLMGWNYADIERMVTENSPSQDELIWHFLLSWRNMCKTKDDLGLPVLVTALSKGGRKDLCTVITLDLREWISNEDNKKTKFYRWAIKAFDNSDLMNPGDYPPPLSDQFLVLLVDMIKSQMDIMEPLGLTQKEVERVMASNRYKGLDEKLLKLFIMGREKASLKKDYLKKMVRVFDHYGLQEAKRWLVIACKKWLEDNEKSGDPLYEDVNNVIKSIGSAPHPH